MNKKKFIMASLILIGAAFITSCKKEKVKGCTTSYATNYNSSAEEDDGSCTYEGSLVFWTPPTTTAAIDVYLDGQLQGNIGVTFPSAPSCGQTGALTVKKSLGTSKLINCTLHATDGTNTWDNTVTFEANKCVSYKIY